VAADSVQAVRDDELSDCPSYAFSPNEEILSKRESAEFLVTVSRQMLSKLQIRHWMFIHPAMAMGRLRRLGLVYKTVSAQPPLGGWRI